MALRMRQQQSNCMAIAQWLQAHPLVRKIIALLPALSAPAPGLRCAAAFAHFWAL